MAAFKAGDKAYIVENNRIVRQCTVVKVSAGNLIVIRFDNGGGIQVRKKRLFPTKEAAEESVPRLKKMVQIFLSNEDIVLCMIIGTKQKSLAGN